MLNTGFGFQAWNAKRGVPQATAVGEQLAAQQQPTAGLPGLGLESMLGRPPRGPAQEQEIADAFDPTQEHSPSNTAAALEDAVRRAQDLTSRPALKKPPAPNQAWQLATLGLDPLSIQLFTQTGDAAGGVG